MADIFHLGAFATAGDAFVGLVLEDQVVPLADAAGRAGVTFPKFDALADLLGDWDRNFDCLWKIARHARSAGIEEFAATPLAESAPLPPLGRVGKLLYSAANYSDHVNNMRRTFTPSLSAEEQAKPLTPLRPYMFGRVNLPTGAFDDIVLPAGMERIDWEAELMVAIGRPGRAISASQAGAHIAGYMTTNDVSCRDLTWRTDRPTIRSDWMAGKSFDTFAPIGPYLTPKAFVPDHSDLAIRLWVNGVIKQDGNTRDMTFGVEEQIEYASRMVTLLPGDVIATGTPAGTGQERLEFLKAGDVVETEVEHCGRQRNRVVAPVGEA